ncbi:MAG: hypothetical protein OJJ21_24230 [Ferrovibrio sp.]|uniref:hypothetical protein n=1 Tax=Ferrovibrio sp. TaxID=1917215 RepID=UPI00260B958B|nr:hypothetical protein [Ferrovibrio sp.]MCW0236725.1 hypothetical protein [Ferrovibrio sp.]
MAKVTKIVEIANDDDDEAAGFGEDSIDALTGIDLENGDDLDGLRAVARLAKLVGSLPWFAAVGRKLTATEINDAEAYVAGIGFDEMQVAGVENWLAASAAAQAHDWDDDWWQAEQQMQNALLEQALQHTDEHDLEVALTHVSTRAGEVAHEHAAKMAARQGVSDPALLKVAAGAAAQAAYQAALVLAARSAESEDDGEHPFAIKFRLFEAGRLPLGIVGSTFNLF